MKNKISHYIFYISIIFIFSILLNYKNLSKADEKWTIKKFEKLRYYKGKYKKIIGLSCPYGVNYKKNYAWFKARCKIEY